MKELHARKTGIQNCINWGTEQKGQQRHPRHVMPDSDVLQRVLTGSSTGMEALSEEKFSREAAFPDVEA